MSRTPSPANRPLGGPCPLAGLLCIMLLRPGAVLADPLNVVVSTTLLEGIVAGIGGERVAVTSVIPYAMCPGHFDLSPHMANAIATSGLFLQHGFEAFARGLPFASGGPKRGVLMVSGNGMIPDVHRALVREATAVLCEANPASATYYQDGAARYLARVDAAEVAVRDGRAALAGLPVVTAGMNAAFVEWAGCRVVAQFPRDEGVSAGVMLQLARMARREGVRLVVENRQSAGRTGETLAHELDVPLVMLSNFPDVESGGYPVELKAAIRALQSGVGH